MKRLFFFSIAILCSILSSGQDIITKLDGSELEAKILEVGIDEIRYKDHSNLDGPVYVIRKAEVFMIKYQNGTKEVIKQEAPAANVVAAPATPIPKQDIKISPDIIRKTNTAGIIGYAMAAPIIGLATAAALSDEFETGGILGGVATLSLGISAPLIAGRARKTREITHVEGSYPARLTGWILYGISMADAIVALGLTIGEVEVPNATVIALGALGAASSILFGVDATRTAEQSKKYVARKGIEVTPALYFSQNHLGTRFTSVGVQITF
jgi:hypothetical protein